jgi:hypothetical protein
VAESAPCSAVLCWRHNLGKIMNGAEAAGEPGLRQSGAGGKAAGRQSRRGVSVCGKVAMISAPALLRGGELAKACIGDKLTE